MKKLPIRLKLHMGIVHTQIHTLKRHQKNMLKDIHKLFFYNRFHLFKIK